ncbi:hypothetical protein ACFX2J_022288 [Malus domestica]
MFGLKVNFGLKKGVGPKGGPKGKIAEAQSKPRRQEKAFSGLMQLMKTTCLPTQRPSGVGWSATQPIKYFMVALHVK